MSAENKRNRRVRSGIVKPPSDEIRACLEMCAALDGERLLIETRHGKEVAELSMELFHGVLHAASDMAKEAALIPALLSGLPFDCCAPWTNARTRSCATAQGPARIDQNDGTGILQNAVATPRDERYPAIISSGRLFH